MTQKPDESNTGEPRNDEADGATYIPGAGEQPSAQRDEILFGRYEILGEIARGGMGVVYRAHDRHLGRIVALKVMIAGENASEEMIKRFLREARASARLKHPNIVPVFDIGGEDGEYFFTMEFVEGKTLGEAIASGGLNPRMAVEIMEKVSQAIDYAHRNGIIHRDIKPGNIILQEDGEPKVMDFGLARELDSATQLTQTGTAMGTPSYMPPEQAIGDIHEVDERSDVYSLGAVLYEMLVTRPPFVAGTVMGIINKVVNEEPVPPVKLNAKINKDIQTICMKCLDKDRARRYQSAGELADDIRRYLNGEPILAVPSGVVTKIIKKTRKHKVSVGVVAAVVVFAAIATWYFLHASELAEQKLQDETRLRSRAEAKRIAEMRNGIDTLAKGLDLKNIELMPAQSANLKSLAALKGAPEYIATFFKSRDEKRKRLAVEYFYSNTDKEYFKQIEKLLLGKNASPLFLRGVVFRMSGQKRFVPAMSELAKREIADGALRRILFLTIGYADAGALKALDGAVPGSSKDDWDFAMSECDKAYTAKKYIAMLNAPDAYTRTEAVHYICEKRVTLAYPEIYRMLKEDKNEGVREVIAYTIIGLASNGDMSSAEAVPALLYSLRHDKSVKVRDGVQKVIRQYLSRGWATAEQAEDAADILANEPDLNIRAGLAYDLSLYAQKGDVTAKTFESFLDVISADTDLDVRRRLSSGLKYAGAKGAVPAELFGRLIETLVLNDDVVTKENIASVLKSISKQDFGADAAKWREWWEANKERILKEEAEKKDRE